jgi:hypothetical protein
MAAGKEELERVDADELFVIAVLAADRCCR